MKGRRKITIKDIIKTMKLDRLNTHPYTLYIMYTDEKTSEKVKVGYPCALPHSRPTATRAGLNPSGEQPISRQAINQRKIPEIYARPGSTVAIIRIDIRV